MNSPIHGKFNYNFSLKNNSKFKYIKTLIKGHNQILHKINYGIKFLELSIHDS